MAYTLPPLPYDYTALEPCITKSTLEFHHDKHHAAYVNNYNGLVKDTELDALSLEEVIIKVAGDASKAGVFNNAAQAWNHSFYWDCMKPGGGGAPTGALAAKINADFGSFEKFVEAFKTAGATQFGSGWAWLVLDNGTLKVTKTGNADNPLTAGQVPLLTMDDGGVGCRLVRGPVGGPGPRALDPCRRPRRRPEPRRGVRGRVRARAAAVVAAGAPCEAAGARDAAVGARPAAGCRLRRAARGRAGAGAGHRGRADSRGTIGRLAAVARCALAR